MRGIVIPPGGITQEQLKSLLDYNQETGIFTWIAKQGKSKVGNPAGSLNSDGYVMIGLGSKRYYAHILAWLYVKGENPSCSIDHKDGSTGNNIWSNLRLATKSQNATNSKRPSTNTSGYKGVYWHKKAQKWHAQITMHGKRIYLGLFISLEDAQYAYLEASEKYHGEYGRIS